MEAGLQCSRRVHSCRACHGRFRRAPQEQESWPGWSHSRSCVTRCNCGRLHGRDLLDASLLVSSHEGGANKNLNHLLCHLFTDHLLAQCHDVGVVDCAARLRCEVVMAQRASDTLHLVGRNGDTEACPAHHDAKSVRLFQNLFAAGLGVVRIVTSLGGVASGVHNLKSIDLPQMLSQLPLEPKACVVTPQHYLAALQFRHNRWC
mmetsp:Transcript_35710/g.48672  ORF Transcript_35710/g.48672 Transcript_35710/m.48672 type:complete len:204 (+) Transcript_35710:93-704(+)